MPESIADRAFAKQGALRKKLEAGIPAGLRLHGGGTGNKKFLHEVNETTGYWRRDTGRVRWIFHVVPADGGFAIQLPEEKEAGDLPGGLNATYEDQAAVLTFATVVLVRKSDGTYAWPEGWLWTTVFVLEKPIGRTGSSSVKIHGLDLQRNQLHGDRVSYPIKDWTLAGLIDPETSFSDPAYREPLTYGRVGEALAAAIGALGVPLEEEGEELGGGQESGESVEPGEEASED